jgi:DNA-binding MurR/RpiR family transcriptional regulator
VDTQTQNQINKIRTSLLNSNNKHLIDLNNSLNDTQLLRVKELLKTAEYLDFGCKKDQIT